MSDKPNTEAVLALAKEDRVIDALAQFDDYLERVYRTVGKRKEAAFDALSKWVHPDGTAAMTEMELSNSALQVELTAVAFVCGALWAKQTTEEDVTQDNDSVVGVLTSDVPECARSHRKIEVRKRDLSRPTSEPFTDEHKRQWNAYVASVTDAARLFFDAADLYPGSLEVEAWTICSPDRQREMRRYIRRMVDAIDQVDLEPMHQLLYVLTFNSPKRIEERAKELSRMKRDVAKNDAKRKARREAKGASKAL